MTLLDDSLVSAEWLLDHLGHPELRIVDIRGYVETEDHGGGRQTATYRGAIDEYEAGHIPGAVFIDWTTDIVDPDAEVKAQIAPPEVFAEAMSSRGIGNDTDVVIVDHTGGHFATRLWWALTYYGHDRVAVLDGGYRRWVAESYPVETSNATYPSRSFATRIRPGLMSDARAVEKGIGQGDRQLIDARDGGQFSGAVQRGSRGGHIPGAVNFPAKDLFDSAGSWKPATAIAEAARTAGIDLDKPVTAYCNGGVTATAVLFGLHRAGVPDLSNYDGSWNEWGERDDLPVEGNRDLWSDDAT